MFRINASNSPFIFGMLLVFILVAFQRTAQAQCYGYQRYYVSIAEDNSNVPFVNTDVKDEAKSLGSNLTDYSTIDVSTALSVTRFSRLKFAKTFTGGEPIHVKLERELLINLLGITIDLQAYNNGVAVGSKVTLSGGLLGAVAGRNIVDIVIPNPSNAYNAVQITVSAGTGVNNIVRVYAAYVDEAITTGVSCSNAADVIYGVTSGLLGGVNDVDDAADVADNFPTTTFATLKQNLSATGYVHVTSLLHAPTVIGDSVSVAFKVPGSALLDVDLFTNLSVVMYLANTQVGTVPADASSIKIRLLDDNQDIYQFTFPANYSFDRISVQFGGLATVLTEVRVYDIRVVLPKPIATINGNVASSTEFCVGGSTTLGIQNPKTCAVYNWYSTAVSPTPVFTGSSFPRNSLTPGTYNYYVEEVRFECTSSASGRTQQTIIVNSKPGSPAVTVSATN